MTKKASNAPGFGFGSVRADEVLPLREAARRLGFAQDALRKAQSHGLRTVRFGKLRYVRGADVLDFFAALIEGQTATQRSPETAAR
jgi:hypothetical protein